jgi:hypothetical protein
MVRLWLVVGVIVAVFYIFSVVDCALIERNRVRGLPKAVWVLVVIILPVIGGILWFLIGRGGRRNTARRSLAPDDDPEFLKRIAGERADRDRQQAERIRKLEDELADLDDPTTKKGPAKGSPKKGVGDTGPKDPAPKNPTPKNPGEGDQPGRRDG